MVTAYAPLNVFDVLRGDRRSRPSADHTIADGLRAILADGIYDILGPQRPDPSIVVRAATLRQPPRTVDLSQSPLGRIRGVLVNQLLRLLCVGADVVDPFDDAVSAWRFDVGTNELVVAFDRLDADDRARLNAEVRAHFSSLEGALGTIRAHWMPRSAVRATQRLADGAVELRDVVDLVVGAPSRDVAATALLDVTTAPLGHGDERTIRYHALVHTLRTSTMPLRTSALSTATNEFWTRDVDFALLARSVDDVLAVVDDLWRAR